MGVGSRCCSSAPLEADVTVVVVVLIGTKSEFPRSNSGDPTLLAASLNEFNSDEDVVDTDEEVVGSRGSREVDDCSKKSIVKADSRLDANPSLTAPLLPVEVEGWSEERSRVFAAEDTPMFITSPPPPLPEEVEGWSEERSRVLTVEDKPLAAAAAPPLPLEDPLVNLSASKFLLTRSRWSSLKYPSPRRSRISGFSLSSGSSESELLSDAS